MSTQFRARGINLDTLKAYCLQCNWSEAKWDRFLLFLGANGLREFDPKNSQWYLLGRSRKAVLRFTKQDEDPLKPKKSPPKVSHFKKSAAATDAPKKEHIPAPPKDMTPARIDTLRRGPGRPRGSGKNRPTVFHDSP